MTKRTYQVVLDWAPKMNGWVTTVPQLGGISTWGRTEEEALAATRELIAGFIKTCILTGRQVPELRPAVPVRSRPNRKTTQVQV